MTQQELLEIIRESSPEDWEVFESPTFLSNITMYNEETIHADYHTYRASYRNDISIGLAWGINVNEDFHEEWANRHPNPHASSQYFDVYYNGMLVYRATYVSIDGHRSFMPLPHRQQNPDGSTSWYISRQEYELFGLFNHIQPFDTQYNSYLERSGITVI